MRPKRLISLLVAVCMMITMLPLSAVTAFAEDTSSSPDPEAIVDGYKYAYTVNADGKTATITEFRGPVSSENNGSYDITIPTELGGHTVTAIGNYAFQYCDDLTNVTIPQSVTSIGDYAFDYCSSLDSLIIKDAATSIGKYAFCGCEYLTTLLLGKNITTIGEDAFWNCQNLDNVTIPQSVTSIGDYAFDGCSNLKSLTINDAATSIGEYAFAFCSSLTSLSLGKNITTIGEYAFYDCDDLTNVTIPEKVETIERDTFNDCSHLESITLPAGLKFFKDDLTGCPADCVIYYKNYKAAARDRFGENAVGDNAVLAGHKLLYLCKVTFDAKGGNLTDYDKVPVYKTEKITDTKANELTAIHDPTRPGYKFTGWYADGKLFDVSKNAITEDITLYAGWKSDPNAPVCRPLTLKDGVITSVTVPGKDGADPEDITEIVKKNANEDGSFNVPEGATVSVAFDKDAFADSGLKFGHWDITGLDDPNAYQNKESFDFVMPAKGVTLKAMTQDASIEDDEPDIVGPIVIGTTVVVGGAVLGYQAYSLGAEFAGKLLNLPYFPNNRSALAMMLWEDAGKPMPESELLYPDVEQEEQDMDLQHAARWAMENELIPDLNDEGTAPEEMKFYPDNAVSKIDVLKAWQKAQELKQNA